MTSCDPSQVGTSIQNFTASNGCDSTITTITTLGEPTTVTLNETTCNPMETGTVTTTFFGGASNGCDSVVIVITSLLPKANVTVQMTTCDQNEVGSFTDTIYGGAANGCDSVITTVVSYIPPSMSTIQATTCDPSEVGTSSTTISGGASSGCDSIITTITTLLPSNEVVLNEITCDENSAGSFIEVLTNQNGCDSTVTTIVSYLPPPIASFRFFIDGLTVTFENTSQNDMINGWSLGDGTIVTNSDDFEHVYNNGGYYDVILGVSNLCGTDNIKQTVRIVGTAINLNTLIESIVLYPNPNTGQFALELEGNGVDTKLSLQLIDVTGKVIDAREVTFNGYLKENYAFEYIPSGTYLLHINSEEGQTTLKVNITK